MCYFTKITTIICDSPQRQILVADYPWNFQQNWLHFTLSISKLGSAFIQIKSGSEIIAYNQVDSNFIFSQNEDAHLCIGMCLKNIQTLTAGFSGDIREVYLRNYYFNNRTTLESFDYNVIQSYRSDVLGYYRLKDANDEFNTNQVLCKTALSEGTNCTFNYEIAPVDVCPVTTNVRSFVQIDNKKGQQIKPKDLGLQLKLRDYEYTMSLTLFIERDQCWTRNLTQAVFNCSIVNLDRVFILYLSAPNLARFHFFAEKNYFESQTAQFFIPFNQWITIQMQMTQYTGYQVVVLDSQGQILNKLRLNYNMQMQKPNSRLFLFNGLRGLVSRFILTNSAVAIPTPNYLLVNSLINLNFQNLTSIKQSLFMVNAGKSGMIQFNYVPNLKDVNYVNFEYGQPRKSPRKQQFDGITCKNKHQFVSLDRSKYDLSVQIPKNKVKSNQQTIQFWFKLGDPNAYKPQNLSIDYSVQIFEIIANKTYWQIYLQDSYLNTRSATTITRTLTIAPYGNTTNQIIRFTEFKQQNEDKWGWWHLSCSYSYKEIIECILFNSKIRIKRQLLINSVQQQIPTDQFTCYFRKYIDQLSVKNFRVWSNQQSVDEVRVTRYQNVKSDPNLIVETSFLDATDLLQTNFLVEYLPSIYDDKTNLIKNVTMQSYHLVCPPKTYFKNNYCYDNPLNQIVFTVFPVWNNINNELFWTFSLENTLAILNISQLTDLNITFTSTDQYLQRLLQNSSQDYSIQIQSKKLRDEIIYNVQSLVTNNRFYNYTEIQFVPQKCSWLEVAGSDAFSGRQVYSSLPGTDNITFIIEEIKNPSLNCTNQIHFYDQLALNFQYDLLIQTADDQYYTDKPLLIFEQFFDLGVRKIKVTIPSSQQFKLPPYTDIKILINIQWQSLMAQEFNIPQQNLIFQHIMYTISLQPTVTALGPLLIANTQQVSMGQTLVLSTKNTTVNNINLQLIKNQLDFQWSCPIQFISICYGQAHSDKLIIPYNQLIQNSSILFQYQYNFTVQIQWNRNDGNVITSNETVGVTWYDDQSMPKFKIECKILPLGFNKTQTSCSIKGRDFDAGWALGSYFVDWVITSPQEQQLATVIHYILNGNEQFIIDQNLLQNQKTYLILATITLRDYNSIKSLLYYSLNYNVPVLAQINNSTNSSNDQENQQGLFGSNQQTQTNSTDIVNNGTQENILINQTQSNTNSADNDTTLGNTTQSQDKKTDNNTTQSNTTQSDSNATNFIQAEPIEITFNDNKTNGDSTYTNTTDIQTILTNQTQSNENTTTSESMSANTTNDKNLVDQTESDNNLTINVTMQLQTAELDSNITNTDITQLNSTEFQNSFESNDSQQNATELIIQDTIDLFNQNQSQAANDSIVSEQIIDGNRRLEDNELLLIYEELQNFIPKDNTQFVQDFANRLQLAFAQTPNVAILFNSYDVLAYLVDVYELKADNLLPILQTLRVYASNVQDEVIISNILERLLDLPISNYQTQDFQIASSVFNHRTALLNIPVVMQALNSNFTLSPQDLYYQFATESMHDYYMQSIAIQDTLNQTQVYLRVIDSVSLESYSIGQLSGRAEITFQLPPNNSAAVQCATNQDSDWNTEFCLTEFMNETSIAKCTCNMMQATLITMIPDISYEIQKINKVASEQMTIEDSHSTDIKGVSYSFIAMIGLISFKGILITIIVWRLDRKDYQNQKIPFTQVQIEFLKKVSEDQNQPLEQVQLRGHQLIKYQVQSQNTLVWISLGIHPYLAPFSTFNPIQSRLLRFSTYQFQINLYVLLTMIYFYNDIYRKGDVNRREYLLDSVDIGNLFKIIFVGQLLLIPSISVIFDMILSNRLVVNINKIEIIPSNTIQRGLFIVLCQVLNISTLVAAIDISINSPATNQICSEFAIFAGIIFALLCTNMIRVLFNRFAPNSLRALKSEQTRQIVNDVLCVKKIMANEIEMQGPAANEDGVFQTEQPIIKANVQQKSNYSGIIEQAPPSAREE